MLITSLGPMDKRLNLLMLFAVPNSFWLLARTFVCDGAPAALKSAGGSAIL